MDSSFVAPSNVAHFRFFGRDLTLVADDPEIVTVLGSIYARYRVAPGGAAASAGSDFTVVIPGGPGTATGPTAPIEVRVRSTAAGDQIEVEGRLVRVPARAQLAHYAHLVLINAAAAGAQDLVVLHAGAVARGNRAALFVGPSGWGKSTLTLELVRRGWEFLSDDFAPLSPDGSVTPFPRRVNVTDDTLSLLHLEEPSAGLRIASFGGLSKWMLDIDDVFPGRLAGPTPVGTVFLLQGDPATAAGFERRWRIQLDHTTPAIESDLAALAGVRHVTRRPSDEGVVFDLMLEAGARVVATLDAVCREHNVTVLAADRSPWSRPDFNVRPSVQPVAISDALTALLTHATSVSGQRFLYPTQPSDLLRSMSVVHRALGAAGARVFRLQPGELSETAALIESTAT